MGATLVASDTAPLREVAGPEHVRLSPFHDADALAQRVIEVLEAPGDFAHLGLAARAHIVERYDFMTKCLPVHLQKINDLVPMAKRIALPG